MNAIWKVEPSTINKETNAPFCYYIIEGGKIIATTWVNHDDKQTQQHAHIMAAAPVLYEACEILFKITTGMMKQIPNSGFEPGSPLGKCEAALAKARGEG